MWETIWDRAFLKTRWHSRPAQVHFCAKNPKRQWGKMFYTCRVKTLRLHLGFDPISDVNISNILISVVTRHHDLHLPKTLVAAQIHLSANTVSQSKIFGSIPYSGLLLGLQEDAQWFKRKAVGLGLKQSCTNTQFVYLTNWLLLQHSGSLSGLLPKPVLFASLSEVARGQVKLSHTTRNSFSHQSLLHHKARDLDAAIPWLGWMYVPVWEEKPWLRTASPAYSTFSDKTFLAFCQLPLMWARSFPRKLPHLLCTLRDLLCAHCPHHRAGWDPCCPAHKCAARHLWGSGPNTGQTLFSSGWYKPADAHYNPERREAKIKQGNC